ncbi:hypothetical protein LCL87_25070 [Rhodococcus hoagii]|nr:hypothetical protein [Prescottella equi]
MLVFATEDQLSSWLGTPGPLNAGVLLREASILVRDACRCDVFDTLPNGLPEDDDKREALQDATCAQAATWAATGDDPLKGPGGQEPRMTLSGIDGAQVSFDTYLTAGDRAKSLTQLCASAYRILRSAGLASSAVQS